MFGREEEGRDREEKRISVTVGSVNGYSCMDDLCWPIMYSRLGCMHSVHLSVV